MKLTLVTGQQNILTCILRKYPECEKLRQRIARQNANVCKFIIAVPNVTESEMLALFHAVSTHIYKIAGQNIYGAMPYLDIITNIKNTLREEYRSQKPFPEHIQAVLDWQFDESKIIPYKPKPVHIPL